MHCTQDAPERQAPAPLRLPCPCCGADVLFPFDPVKSAILDRVDTLVEDVQALQSALQEVCHDPR
jgi:hypothetical protein